MSDKTDDHTKSFVNLVRIAVQLATATGDPRIQAMAKVGLDQVTKEQLLVVPIPNNEPLKPAPLPVPEYWTQHGNNNVNQVADLVNTFTKALLEEKAKNERSANSTTTVGAGESPGVA